MERVKDVAAVVGLIATLTALVQFLGWGPSAEEGLAWGEWIRSRLFPAIVPLGVGVIGGFALGKRRRRALAARRLVRTLHDAWFPGNSVEETSSSGHRVSVFIPFRLPWVGILWWCYARSVGHPPQRRLWRQTKEPDRESCGVVVRTALDAAGLDFPGVPIKERSGADADDEPTPSEEEYRRRCGLTYSDWRARTWRGATIKTFVAHDQARVSAIFVLERKDGLDLVFRDDPGIPLRHIDGETKLAAATWAAHTGA